jgi:hypothetical protein
LLAQLGRFVQERESVRQEEIPSKASPMKP